MRTLKNVLIIVLLSFALVHCGKEEGVAAPAPISEFTPYSGPYAGMPGDPNANPNLLGDFAARYPNTPVYGPNGYSSSFQEYYRSFYQGRSGGIPNGYQMFFNGQWQPMGSFFNGMYNDPSRRNYYLNLDWQKNPWSGRTGFGGFFGIR